MSNILNAAAAVRAPHDVGRTANDFGVLKFTAGSAADTTVHFANAIPTAWRGFWVELYVSGGTPGTDRMDFAFSGHSNAEVSTAVAASAAGASDKVGASVPTGTTLSVLVPPTGDSTLLNPPPIYFVRESTAAGMICTMRLAS